ncbi:MAG: sigma-70 family RNA polymerase sigma factor [Candidatus Dojkabacteria bacterium]|nr:sigma-70 family RNA polymerase sigma factor [Candidatus Dojkabacteria bacterium]
MTVEEELKLVEKAKKNIQYFDKIYDYYFYRILKFCVNKVSSSEIAEDITSRVFLSAVEKIIDFDTSKNIRFGSWLYRNANNKIIDYYRKNARTSWFDIEDESVVPDEEQDDHEKELTLKFKQKKLSLVISTLNARYQKIISLRFYSDLDIDEIAEEMNLNNSNVSVLLHRALKALQKKYLEMYPDSESF